MAVQTTSNLSNAIRTKYTYLYREAMMQERLYDMFAIPAGADQGDLEKREFMGSSYQWNFLSDMTPGTSSISQTNDITPQQLSDATATVSPTSRGDAIQWAEAVDIQAFTNYGASSFQKVGKAAMESVEILGYTAALAGGLVQRAAARASLDAGTSSNRWTDTTIAKAAGRINSLKCPPLVIAGQRRLLAVAHPDAFYDLFSGGNVVSVAQYQNQGLIFNPYRELGEIHGFKLMISPWAKVFGAAGADNASAVGTTLSSAASALGTSIVLASATNVAAGQYLTIGTEETGSTFHPTNELVQVHADYTSGTTITVVGEGSNGGLRFDHAAGAAVRNADNVYPVVYGSPQSMVKIFSNQIGPFAQVVGPKTNGVLDQFRTLGYKWYGGYGLIADNYLMRGEYASSVQA